MTARHIDRQTDRQTDTVALSLPVARGAAADLGRADTVTVTSDGVATVPDEVSLSDAADVADVTRDSATTPVGDSNLHNWSRASSQKV